MENIIIILGVMIILLYICKSIKNFTNNRMNFSTNYTIKNSIKKTTKNIKKNVKFNLELNKVHTYENFNQSINYDDDEEIYKEIETNIDSNELIKLPNVKKELSNESEITINDIYNKLAFNKYQREALNYGKLMDNEQKLLYNQNFRQSLFDTYSLI